MNKELLIKRVGGVARLADLIGVTHQAVYSWPNPLTQRIQDRVAGALHRNHMIDLLPDPLDNPPDSTPPSLSSTSSPEG
jgi:hypothetical protein